MALVLYLALVAAAYLIVRAYMLVSDHSQHATEVESLPRCEPFEVAFLRDGTVGALRDAITPMIAQGLIVVEGNTVSRASLVGGTPNDDFEYAVYDALRSGRKISLTELERTVSGPLHRKLTRVERLAGIEGLLLPTRIRTRMAILASLLALALVAGALVLGAFDASRTSGMPPIAYGLAATIGLLAIAFGARSPRLSERGRKYLALQSTSA